MLEEYGVLIDLILLIFIISTFCYNHLSLNKNIKKIETEKLLERVYNPLEKAITVLHSEIKNDKTNIKGDSFKKFENAYLDIKENYGNLIDGETDKYIHDMYRANEDVNNLYSDEKYKNFIALIGIARTHTGHKIKNYSEI